MNDIDVKEKIIKGAEELFMRYGVRSITMDEIARHLGVSKKTIYLYFSDKDEIVLSVAQSHLGTQQKQFDKIADESKNSVEELVRLSFFLKENMKGVNPAVLFDLQKYHPKAWSAWMEYKRNVIKDSVVRNLKQGIKEGYFRSDINPEILAVVRLETIQMGFDDQVFPRDKFNLTQVQLHILEHFIHGLLTEKGKKLYNKYRESITEPSINDY